MKFHKLHTDDDIRFLVHRSIFDGSGSTFHIGICYDTIRDPVFAHMNRKRKVIDWWKWEFRGGEWGMGDNSEV
jgi:hypothetical protein